MHRTSTTESVGRTHLHRAYDEAHEWYKSADSKAQVILTLDGAFITFLGGTVFTKPDEVARVVGVFGVDTWILLALMCVAVGGSIAIALTALWSRIYSADELEEGFKHAGMNTSLPATYKPQFMTFFQHVSKLQAEGYAECLGSVDENFERVALSHQLVELSTRVTEKHVMVNRAFVLAGLSVGLFLASAVNFIAHLHLAPAPPNLGL